MVSNENSTVSKTCGSALKIVVVPLRSACGPTLLTGVVGMPREYSWAQTDPSRGGLDSERLGERVDDADADAVKATGDLVAAAAELGAGMEDGMDDLEGVLAAGMAADRHTPTVVGDANGAVLEDADLDMSGMAGHGFVD